MIGEHGKCYYGSDLRDIEKKLADKDINPASLDSVDNHFGEVMHYIFFLDNTGMRGDNELLQKALMIFDRFHRRHAKPEDGNGTITGLKEAYKVAHDVAEKSGLKGYAATLAGRLEELGIKSGEGWRHS